MAEQKEQTLFGLPVIVTDAIPPGEVLLGRLPTWQEILEHGSLEKAIEAQARQWAKIKGIATE